MRNNRVISIRYFSRVRILMLVVVVCVASVGCYESISREELRLMRSGPITKEPTPAPVAIITPTSTNVPVTPTATMVVPTMEPTPTPSPTVTPIPTPTPEPSLFLDILEPLSGISTESRSILLRGNTLPTARLVINDRPVTVGIRGDFNEEINLVPGQNVIEVVVTSVVGSRLRDFLIVKYNEPAPYDFFLLIETPIDNIQVIKQIIEVTGRTAPEAVVKVNGNDVLVDDAGNFSIYVQLRAGNNVVKISATNTDGKLLLSERKVFYVP